MVNQGATLDRVFHALADPTRRVIVERLSVGSASVTELARPLDMSLPAVLQHIHVLEMSGLIHSEKVGRTRTCQVDPLVLNSMQQWIDDRKAAWERRFDRLSEYLEGDQDMQEQGASND